MTGSSTQGIKTVLHPVSDLAAAKAVYTALLGLPPQADSDYYVGFDVGGQHVGLLPGGGPQGMTSPVTYWQVTDIEAKLAEVTAAAWWPPSATPTATSSGCFRIHERRGGLLTGMIAGRSTLTGEHLADYVATAG